MYSEGGESISFPVGGVDWLGVAIGICQLTDDNRKISMDRRLNGFPAINTDTNQMRDCSLEREDFHYYFRKINSLGENMKMKLILRWQ